MMISSRFASLATGSLLLLGPAAFFFLYEDAQSRFGASGGLTIERSERKLRETPETDNMVVTGSLNTLTRFLQPTDASIYGLNTIENGVFLVDAITIRMLAVTGHPVPYADGTQSTVPFHVRPDGAQVFEDSRSTNIGGWILTSNSEVVGGGGVGAVTFNANGDIINYQMVLTGTTMNCNGGKTFFGAWISCEEDFSDKMGRAWQVDPTGARAPQPITLGSGGGAFEAFAYDVRNTSQPHFFLTEDQGNGPVYRWTPSNPDFSSPWDMLLGTGTEDYLLLSPDSLNPSTGTFSWTTDINAGRSNAQANFPNSEGIDVSGNTLFFVSKVTRFLFELNLDTGTYTRVSTISGLFDGQPDIIRNVLAADTGGPGGTMLYFTEDGGARSGIHARDDQGNLYTLLESSLFQGETTGLSISPDGTRIYFQYQFDGILFELRRRDGQSFRGTTLNLKSHPSEITDEKRQRERKLYT